MLQLVEGVWKYYYLKFQNCVSASTNIYMCPAFFFWGKYVFFSQSFQLNPFTSDSEHISTLQVKFTTWPCLTLNQLGGWRGGSVRGMNIYNGCKFHNYCAHCLSKRKEFVTLIHSVNRTRCRESWLVWGKGWKEVRRSPNLGNEEVSDCPIFFWCYYVALFFFFFRKISHTSIHF